MLLSALQPTKASGDLIPCTLLIILIVWVLVAGYATATECAAYGVLGSLAIAVLTLVYRVLGIALDGSSTIVHTLAVVLPMIQKAGFELIWFSILIVLLETDGTGPVVVTAMPRVSHAPARSLPACARCCRA